MATDAHGNAMIYAEHEASTGGGPVGGGSVGGTSGGAGGGSGGGESGAVTLHAGRTLSVTHNTVHIGLQCAGSGTCSGKATLSIFTPVAHGLRLARPAGKGSRTMSVAIGTHAFSIAAGKSATVTIHLNAAGKKALRAGHGKLKARLAISGVASGKSVNESKAVTLKTSRK